MIIFHSSKNPKIFLKPQRMFFAFSLEQAEDFLWSYIIDEEGGITKGYIYSMEINENQTKIFGVEDYPLIGLEIPKNGNNWGDMESGDIIPKIKNLGFAAHIAFEEDELTLCVYNAAESILTIDLVKKIDYSKE